MIDEFLKQFSGYSETYSFYNGDIQIMYDISKHTYLLVSGDDLIEVPSVTTVVKKAVDKSEILLPWACKVMGSKLKSLISSFPISITEAYFDHLVEQSKKAHKEKLDEAGLVGNIAHNWIEQRIKERIEHTLPVTHRSPFPADTKAMNACKAMLSWEEAHNVRWLSTERKIYSKTHKYAGTMDGLAMTDSCSDPLCCPKKFQNRLSLIDWKTSNNLYLDYLFQISAYWGAYVEETSIVPEDGWVIRLGKDDAEFDPWHIWDEDEFEMYFYGFLNARRWYESMEYAKKQVKLKNEHLRTARKEVKRLEKEEKLKLKCAYADKYKGVRKPNCGCKACISKWNNLHPNDQIA